MLLARLVVEKRLALGGLQDAGVGDRAAPVGLGREAAASSRMVRAARASALARRAMSGSASSVDLDLEPPRPRSRVGQGPPHDRDELVLPEAAQHVHAAAREQRRVHLEGRVLGGGADEDDRALLDVGQEGVLLGAVEAVDLVDEQDRAQAAAPALASASAMTSRISFTPERTAENATKRAPVTEPSARRGWSCRSRAVPRGSSSAAGLSRWPAQDAARARGGAPGRRSRPGCAAASGRPGGLRRAALSRRRPSGRAVDRAARGAAPKRSTG